jgi:hypothetical protein
MNNYWLSWYHSTALGPFELHSPWWVSGERVSDGAATVCAAVKANDEKSAKLAVIASYDETPTWLEWRFCEEKPVGWEPFGDRFPRGYWMQWP